MYCKVVSHLVGKRFCAGLESPALAYSLRRSGSKRLLSTEAKAVQPSSPSGSGGLGKRISGFAFGVAFASVGFYYQLHQDVWSSTAKIEEALSTFQKSSIEENSLLRHRIAVLEKELSILKAKV